MGLMNPAYAVTSGKYYWEHKLISESHPTVANLSMPGIIDLNVDKDLTSYIGHTSGPTTYSWYTLNGILYFNGTNSGSAYLVGGSTKPAIGDIINFALDMDNGAWYIGINGTYVTGADGSVGNPASGSAKTGAVVTFSPNTRKYIYGTSTQSGYNCVDEVNFGQKSFSHSIPSGYTKWQQDNLPETSKGVSGFVWVKDRDSASLNHALFDSSRGPTKYLNSNTTGAEGTGADTLTKFLKGGFATEDGLFINTSGDSFVSWNWVANGGTTASNSDGSITSTVQANTTAGFSIVQYTGTGSAATVGHGLSSKPDWMLIKDINNANGFIVSHKGLTSQATYSLNLTNTNAEYSDAGTYYWNSTAPTSSVFSIATDTAVNGSSRNYVAYCWNSVSGYSSFGKYVGNGNADGPFVYTGFKPAFIMLRATAGGSWVMLDNTRNPTNPINRTVWANLTSAESTSYTWMDFLSNGFKLRDASNGLNNSGATYIYMSFAQHPFVGDGTNPVTAR
jgi:hypothetical protein